MRPVDAELVELQDMRFGARYDKVLLKGLGKRVSLGLAWILGQGFFIETWDAAEFELQDLSISSFSNKVRLCARMIYLVARAIYNLRFSLIIEQAALDLKGVELGDSITLKPAPAIGVGHDKK